MCGRFAFYSPREAVAELFGVEAPLDFQPRYNLAPTQSVAVIRTDANNAPNVAMLRWGLIPSWAKDIKIGQRLINARAETVHEKPSFRAAFKRRRCVVLADGFYEWRKMESGKQPYFIVQKDHQPFAMAGLWEHWSGEDGSIESCTIITTAANTIMQDLHARMPVILPPANACRWIDHESRDVDGLRKELSAGDDPTLEFWPVSRDVNSPRNDTIELIREVPAAG